MIYRKDIIYLADSPRDIEIPAGFIKITGGGEWWYKNEQYPSYRADACALVEESTGMVVMDIAPQHTRGRHGWEGTKYDLLRAVGTQPHDEVIQL